MIERLLVELYLFWLGVYETNPVRLAVMAVLFLYVASVMMRWYLRYTRFQAENAFMRRMMENTRMYTGGFATFLIGITVTISMILLFIYFAR